MLRLIRHARNLGHNLDLNLATRFRPYITLRPRFKPQSSHSGMPKRKEESDDPEDEDEEDLGSKKSAKTKAKATPRKKKVALAPAPSITEDGWHLHPPSFMFKYVQVTGFRIGFTRSNLLR